ncbi:MAG: hypothetical protein ABIO55_03220 [Ginsengibacter sp.]
MKRIVVILGIMFVGIIALLETSSKQKKRTASVQELEMEYDEVWWDK